MGWLPFFLRAQLNNPGFLPDIDSTNQSSTLPLHSPIKLSTSEWACSRGVPRISKHLHLSGSDYFLSAREIQPANLLPPSLHEAPLCKGCGSTPLGSTPRKNEDCCIWIKISIVGGNRLESSLISLYYKCFCWNKLASRYELHTVEYKDRMEDI